MTVITLLNGVKLDDTMLWAPSLNKHLERKGINARVFVATEGQEQNYVLVENGEVVFETKQYKVMAGHIDWLALVRNWPK